MIFQPAEEGGGGGREMVADGMLDRFRGAGGLWHAQHARHSAGRIAIRPGAMMAGGRPFDITITGKAAMRPSRMSAWIPQ